MKKTIGDTQELCLLVSFTVNIIRTQSWCQPVKYPFNLINLWAASVWLIKALWGMLNTDFVFTLQAAGLARVSTK